MDTTTTATARKVEAARNAAGVTIEDLAYASGIPYSSLHRRLRGKAAWTIDQVGSVADALGVEACDLAVFEVAA